MPSPPTSQGYGLLQELFRERKENKTSGKSLKSGNIQLKGTSYIGRKGTEYNGHFKRRNRLSSLLMMAWEEENVQMNVFMKKPMVCCTPSNLSLMDSDGLLVIVTRPNPPTQVVALPPIPGHFGTPGKLHQHLSSSERKIRVLPS